MGGYDKAEGDDTGVYITLSMSTTARSAPGALSPKRQGDLDGLCGLYAIINALRLLLAPVRPLRRCDAAELFEAAIEHMHTKQHLGQAIAWGMGPQIWLDLTVRLATAASETAGHQIKVTRPMLDVSRPTKARLMADIEAAIAARRPVVVSLSGVHDHYTVVNGCSPHRLTLFDSGHLQYLRRVDCGPRTPGKTWRHGINPRLMTVFELVGRRSI